MCACVREDMCIQVRAFVCVGAWLCFHIEADYFADEQWRVNLSEQFVKSPLAENFEDLLERLVIWLSKIVSNLVEINFTFRPCEDPTYDALLVELK